MTVELNEQRRKVFLDRYAKKDENGESTEKTVEEAWDRVACAISTSKVENDEFRKLLDDFKFVPGGRIMAGAGAGTEQTLYNCYVIPVEPHESTRQAKPDVGNDSREAIFDTIGRMVDIMSRGGGVGINWSVLRPSGAYLSRVSGTSSGPVGWMDVASKAVGEVEQGGSRRGAAMFMIDDWHPDVLNFIEAKRDNTKINNANVSVAVSEGFMEAVESDSEWDFVFPDTSDPKYNLEWDGDISKWRESGHRIIRYDTVRARDVWESIVSSAHASGEPGLVFLERYNDASTGRHAERIISVNPCGEQGLGAYSVCNLGSLNLVKYIRVDADHPAVVTDFDFSALAYDARTATRFLDNVIDKSFYWDHRSEDAQKKLRRIGLGVLGLADALIYLGIRYGSPEAVEFTEKVFRVMKDSAIEESMILASEKGTAGAYTDEVWDRPYLKEYVDRKYHGVRPESGLRNLFFLTQAPTGTTSILAGANSGIEPYFAEKYIRKDRTGTHEVWAAPWQQYSLAHLDRVGGPRDSFPDYFVTTKDITVEEHIAMQAAVQKYVDSSVSKTINAPKDQTVEEVDKAYRLAYDSGLKGVTYYRDGSRDVQVLYNENTETEDLRPQLEEALARVAELEAEVFSGPMATDYRRPGKVSGSTLRLNTSMGTMYLTINHDEAGNPVEVFVNVGKAGSDVMAMGEAVGRLVSLGLQKGISLDAISKQLVGVGGTSSFNPGLVHAIGKALDSYEAPKPLGTFSATGPDGVEVEGIVTSYKADPLEQSASPAFSGSVCPDCLELTLIREEGCLKCHSCGYSAC